MLTSRVVIKHSAFCPIIADACIARVRALTKGFAQAESVPVRFGTSLLFLPGGVRLGWGGWGGVVGRNGPLGDDPVDDPPFADGGEVEVVGGDFDASDCI